ncbi:MAG: chemotaxis protein CheC [Bacillota bacterium]|nr:chemotaxis protein CheC [Bacillota bacterium]
MFNDFKELSSLQIDALKEIGNIGAGNAATALAQMVNTKIDLNIPRVSILPFDDVFEYLGGADLPMVGIFLGVTGSAPCNILFLMPVEKAWILVDMLMGRNPDEKQDMEFGEMDISAMMEVGNIIAATYLNALSMFTQLQFYPSVPGIGIDMVGALMDAVLAQFGQIGDHVLLLETQFLKDENGIMGNFFLLPEPGSLDSILSALGVNF